MSERHSSDLPFDSEDPSEKALWAALRDLPEETPSADLRRGFYRDLDAASRETLLGRLREQLGLGSNRGWLTAIACVLLGVVIASGLNVGDDLLPAGDGERLAMLEENVDMLNRELIISRLEDADAGRRLKGVFDARSALSDQQVVQALLTRATGDRVSSIRSAAIEVLGTNLSNTGIAEELMQLLRETESPTVQLALVDMILRNGSVEQQEELQKLAEAGRLHPDLVRHVMNFLGSSEV